MSLTFTNVKSFMPEKGGFRKSIWDVTLDGSYPTGGYVITAANFNLNGILAMAPVGRTGSNTTSPVLAYSAPTGPGSTAIGKLQAFTSNGAAAALLAEATASLGTLNGVIFRLLVIGW